MLGDLLTRLLLSQSCSAQARNRFFSNHGKAMSMSTIGIWPDVRHCSVEGRAVGVARLRLGDGIFKSDLVIIRACGG